MRASDPTPQRRLPLTVLAVALAVMLVSLVAAWRPWGTVSSVEASEEGAAGAATALAPLTIPDSPTVLIFGDSWVYGSAAEVPTLGFAYVVADALGWQATVDGVRGSGYLKAGIDGPDYGTRIADLDPALDPDLIIVEGSINDRRLYPDGYRDAVTAAWETLASTYPEASVVVLGPAPQVLPVEEATAAIDADLADLAAMRGWWYVSPIAEGWIQPANYFDVIDTGVGNDHPSTAGHAYLAERLAASLATLSTLPEVSAEAPLGGW